MPEMKTMFSLARPSSGMKPCTAARMASSPQPGHQRTSWSDLKSDLDCLASAFGTKERASAGMDDLLDGEGELLGLERPSIDLVVRVGVDQVFRPEQGGQLPEVHLGHDHLLVAPQHLTEVLREGVEVAQMSLRDLG